MIKKGAAAIAIALVIALISGYIFYDKILLIAGIYWAFVALVCAVCHFADKRLREVDDDYCRKMEQEEREEAAWFAKLEKEAEPEKEAVAGPEAGTEEMEAAAEDAEETEFSKGKYSDVILWGTFAAVAAVNLWLWFALDPIDETVVAAVKSYFPINWFGAIGVTAVEAFLVGICFQNAYEIRAGVVKREPGTIGNGKLIVILAVIASLLMGWCRFTCEIITEDYYQFKTGPVEHTYYWDDMESFSYNEEFLFEFPTTTVKWNYGSRYYKNLKLVKFNRLTDAYVEKYESLHNSHMMDEIFEERYAHLAKEE